MSDKATRPMRLWRGVKSICGKTMPSTRKKNWSSLLLVIAWTLTACGQVVSGQTPTPSPIIEATSATTLSTIPPRPTATLSMPTAAPPDTPTPSPTPILHVVQPGETLIAIALQYGVTLAALQSANGIERPESLQINQELIIPTGQESQEASLDPLLPTPTPIPFAIEGVAVYETPVGSLWFLGEVTNSTDSSLENVELRVALYNAAGEELVAGNVAAGLDLIPPGGRAPFGILFSSPPTSFDRYRVVPVRAEASTEPADRYAKLEFSETEAGLVGSLFEVTGSVINPGQSAVTSVMVAVTTYDEQGLVTGFRQAKLPDDLPPGAAGDFAVSLVPHEGLPASYHIAVQGRLANP